MVPVRIAGVSKSYDGRTPVLAGIDLDIAGGELFFLLGGSGCGKTTLLRLIAGFLLPDAGTIRFGDEDITGVPVERRGIGMVFQQYALWPHLSVAENVAFGLDVRRVAAAEKRQRVAAALELVALGGFGPRRIAELSGGQQQRVALARALVLRPRVLLFDEPLSNLDAGLRQTMRGEIRRLCKSAGLTALYVTHDQAEALSTADRIALMAAGRIAQVGTPRELYDRPASEAVARFLGDANVLDAAAAARLVDAPPAGDRFCLRPERVRLVAPDAPGARAARIVDGSFQGDRAQWTVELAGLRLSVVEALPRERRAGDPVGLAVAGGDLVPLRP